MNMELRFQAVVAALLVTLPAFGANADQTTDQAQLIQPGFDRLIPTAFPVVRPDFAKLKVTTNPSQLIRPGFDRLIPRTYPVVQPNPSRLKVVTYQVKTAAALSSQPATKSLQPAKN
jgi:hypothetical protein